MHGNPPEHPTTRSFRHKKGLKMGKGEGSYNEMFCDYVSMYMYIKVSLDSPKFELKTVPFLEFYDKISPTDTQKQSLELHCCNTNIHVHVMMTFQ